MYLLKHMIKFNIILAYGLAKVLHTFLDNNDGKIKIFNII